MDVSPFCFRGGSRYYKAACPLTWRYTMAHLTGTVTNTLGTDLNDVYILMNHSFAYIGNLPAQQTQQVTSSLHSSTMSSGSTLADQIAKANHLPVPYFPFASGSQPKNDFQLHLAILSALSGEGYYLYLLVAVYAVPML